MQNSLNIIIIGAGLVGLSSADLLALAGHRVTVIESKHGPVYGASYSNSGMLHPSQSWPWLVDKKKGDASTAFKAVHQLALRSSVVQKNVSARLGFGNQKIKSGCYKIYGDLVSAHDAMNDYKSNSIDTIQVTHETDTLGHPALYFEGDKWGNAREYALNLEADLQRRGINFIYNARSLRLKEKNMRVSLQLNECIIDADHVIIAAGASSSDLMRQVDLELPIKPVSGYAINYERPKTRLPNAPIMDSASHSAITVFDDQLRISGTCDEISEVVLLERWSELAPDIINSLKPAKEIWSGLRPMSLSGKPYICETSLSGLWVNTGHGHMGWTLCAGSAELINEMITKGKFDSRFQITK